MSSVETSILAEDDSPFDAQARAQRKRIIDACLQKLEPRERVFVTLVYGEDLTLDAAGLTVGLTRSGASRLHHRILHRLRRQLARRNIVSIDQI